MIILDENEKKAYVQKALMLHALSETAAKSITCHFLPPYTYRPRSLEGKFDFTKYNARKIDSWETIMHKAEWDAVVCSDLNIVDAINRLGITTKEQLAIYLYKEKAIDPEKEIGVIGASKNALGKRLSVLCRNYLLRQIKCYNAFATDGTIEENKEAPVGYVVTSAGTSILSAKKRGIIRKEKEIESWSPLRFSERLCVNDVMTSLIALKNYGGVGNRLYEIRRNEHKLIASSVTVTIDGCVVLDDDGAEVPIALQAVLSSIDKRIENVQDCEDAIDVKVIGAKEFLGKKRFSGRVIFVCEDEDAINLLMAAFKRNHMSEAGYTEYCYIITEALYRHCIAEKLAPFAYMRQVAYDIEKDEDYIIGMKYRLTETRERQKKEWEQNG